MEGNQSFLGFLQSFLGANPGGCSKNSKVFWGIAIT